MTCLSKHKIKEIFFHNRLLRKSMFFTGVNSEPIPPLYTDEDIKGYMDFCREHFPKESIIPKQHLLECHMTPWLRQWRVSPALLGEQGGEAVHCQLNTISRDLRGYHDDLKLTLQSVKNQWVISSPSTYHKFSTEK